MSGDTWHTELLFPASPSSSPSCGHIVDYDGGSRIRDRDRNGGSCIVLADCDNNGRSCIVLASDSGDGPRLRWQLMVDPDGGIGQWLWTMVASDLDGGSWSWWLLTIDYDYNKTAWYIIFLNSLIFHYATRCYSNQCCKYPFWRSPLQVTSIVLLSILGRDPSHVALSEVSMFFYCSFSLLLLRVKGRGCHTLLSPMRQIVICEYGLYE